MLNWLTGWGPIVIFENTRAGAFSIPVTSYSKTIAR
jgi:hypothetical protein